MPTAFDPIREDALDAARTAAHELDADHDEDAAAAAEDERERREQEWREDQAADVALDEWGTGVWS